MLGFNVVLPEDVFGPAGECLGCMIGSAGVYNCESPGVCGRARVYNWETAGCMSGRADARAGNQTATLF